MAKTLIDLDADLLAEASIALGTTTKKDTITASLRRTVEESRECRRQARESLERMTAEGVFDFDRLAELDE
jgi:Arc/MetJ family transcription regulator